MVLVLIVSVVGCGGDDGGVPDSKKLSELTMQESKDACLALVEDFPERTADCGNGQSVTIGSSASDCDGSVPTADCTATVGDARDCAEAMSAMSDAELCGDPALPSSCQTLFSCN